MAKKAGGIQLQQEVITNEEWAKLLEKEGLIVVDIYSDWCAPCSAMLANLKKVKLEIGGDNLHLEMAKSDNITCLKRFRNRSEPTWMFIAGGKMVNLMFGANAPKLINLIVEELKKEAGVQEGIRERECWEISELAPEEQVRFDAAKALKDERDRIAAENRNRAILERRTAVAHAVLENIKNNGVIVIFPQAKNLYKATLADLWEPAGLTVAAIEKPHFNDAMIEELLYFSETQFSEIDTTNLLSEQTFALLIKTTEDNFTGAIDKFILEFVYGDSKCPPGSPESPAELLKGHVPVPKDIKESVTVIEAVDEFLNNVAGPLLSLTDTNIQSRAELRSQLAILSKTVINSQAELGSNEDQDFLDVSGIWAPPNALTRATAIKLLFPKVYAPIALPEVVEAPPHIAIAFEAFQRKEIFKLMKDYPDAIMRYGFFTDDNPLTAKLIAKTVSKYEKMHVGGTSEEEKFVIQLSTKRSEPWCAFSQLNPTFMSHTKKDGAYHCKLFFPEGYDEPDAEDAVVVDVKKNKAAEEEVAEEQRASEEGQQEGEGEIEGANEADR